MNFANWTRKIFCLNFQRSEFEFFFELRKKSLSPSLQNLPFSEEQEKKLCKFLLEIFWIFPTIKKWLDFFQKFISWMKKSDSWKKYLVVQIFIWMEFLRRFLRSRSVYAKWIWIKLFGKCRNLNLKIFSFSLSVNFLNFPWTCNYTNKSTWLPLPTEDQICKVSQIASTISTIMMIRSFSTRFSWPFHIDPPLTNQHKIHPLQSTITQKNTCFQHSKNHLFSKRFILFLLKKIFQGWNLLYIHDKIIFMKLYSQEKIYILRNELSLSGDRSLNTKFYWRKVCNESIDKTNFLDDDNYVKLFLRICEFLFSLWKILSINFIHVKIGIGVLLLL